MYAVCLTNAEEALNEHGFIGGIWGSALKRFLCCLGEWTHGWEPTDLKDAVSLLTSLGQNISLLKHSLKSSEIDFA